MMLGLAYLKFLGYYLQRTHTAYVPDVAPDIPRDSDNEYVLLAEAEEFDVFDKVARAEWDTLLFFYGVILAVGGLSFLGCLSGVSNYFYGELGATTANILVGLMSAVVDNIPVMFAVLTMHPEMPEHQWLLVTLTAGVGGVYCRLGRPPG